MREIEFRIMREIEFRGKGIDRFHGIWIFGDLLSNTPDERCFIQIKDYIKDPIEIDKNTIGQYTGLKDKNGTKIFDGDIVKYHTESISFEADTIGVIEFCEGTFGIASNKKQHFLSFYNMSAYVRYVEVIGNIYDNPELLEVEK